MTTALPGGLTANLPAGIYALRVEDDSFQDANLNAGDVAIVRRLDECENGDLVLIHVKSLDKTVIRRYFLENGKIKLFAENMCVLPLFCDPADVTVQGKVVATIHNAPGLPVSEAVG